jgi:hypothetical protein
VNYPVREGTNEKLIVGRKDDGATRVEKVPQSVEQVVPRMSILPERGFIKNHNARISREGRGDRESTSLSATEALWVTAVHPSQPNRGSFVSGRFVRNGAIAETIRGVLDDR